MLRPSLDDVNRLPDLVSGNDFLFAIAAVPGGGMGKDLWLKCQRVTLPGVSQRPIDVKLFGHTYRHRGVPEFTPQVRASFLEDSHFNTWRKLWNWFNYTAHTPTGNSVANKSGYSTTGVIIVNDATGAPALQVALMNLQITGLGETELDVGQPGFLQINAEFAFDSMVLGYGLPGSELLGYLLGGGSADALLKRFTANARDFFSGAALGATQGWISEVSGSEGLGALGGTIGAGFLQR